MVQHVLQWEKKKRCSGNKQKIARALVYKCCYNNFQLKILRVVDIMAGFFYDIPTLYFETIVERAIVCNSFISLASMCLIWFM